MSSKRHAWSDRRDETAVVLAGQSVTDADDLGSRNCCAKADTEDSSSRRFIGIACPGVIESDGSIEKGRAEAAR
jgi:hypothetical protein